MYLGTPIIHFLIFHGAHSNLGSVPLPSARKLLLGNFFLDFQEDDHLENAAVFSVFLDQTHVEIAAYANPLTWRHPRERGAW